MTKEPKNILTRESCKKELKRSAKANLIQNSILLAVMLLIFVPLFLLSIYLAKYILALGIALALICTIFPIVFAYRIVRDIIFLRIIGQNGFSIVKDTVLRVSRGELPRSYSEGQSVDAIYFAKHGRYVSKGTAFELTSAGDEFYLVIIHAKKEKIVFAYHSMMYDCKEISEQC